MNEDPYEIVHLALAMRTAQRAYLRTHTRDDLIASKKAEAELDKALVAFANEYRRPDR